MNQRSPETAAPTAAPAGRARLVWSAVLILLAMGGIAVMQYASPYAFAYWLTMVPIFGVVSSVSTRRRLPPDHPARTHLSRRLLLHWSSLALALSIVFLLSRMGHVAPEAAGLVAVVLLGHTCVLVGAHFDWHLIVLGALIMATAVVGAVAEDMFWILLAPTLIALLVLVSTRRAGAS